MRITNYSLVILVSFLIACANSQETVKPTPKKENDVQLLDDQKKNDTIQTVIPQKKDTLVLKKEIIKEETSNSKKFTVQLGAFSTIERASSFINENQVKVEQVMKIVFREDIKLYSVQIPPVATHDEAEKIRNSLWMNPVFKDAFILPIN